jgi:hypothetical protein
MYCLIGYGGLNENTGKIIIIIIIDLEELQHERVGWLVGWVWEYASWRNLILSKFTPSNLFTQIIPLNNFHHSIH